jgi:hypothetical protein
MRCCLSMKGLYNGPMGVLYFVGFTFLGLDGSVGSDGRRLEAVQPPSGGADVVMSPRLAEAAFSYSPVNGL